MNEKQPPECHCVVCTRLTAELASCQGLLDNSKSELAARTAERDGYKCDLDAIARATYPDKEPHFTYSAVFIVDEIGRIRKERDRLQFNAYPHVCQDEHPRIGHSDSEHEMCPLCRAIAERDSAREHSAALAAALDYAIRMLDPCAIECECTSCEVARYLQKHNPAALLAAHDAEVRKPLEEERDALAAALDWFSSQFYTSMEKSCDNPWTFTIPRREGYAAYQKMCETPQTLYAAILADVRAKARAEALREAAEHIVRMWGSMVKPVAVELDRMADAEEAGKGTPS